MRMDLTRTALTAGKKAVRCGVACQTDAAEEKWCPDASVRKSFVSAWVQTPHRLQRSARRKKGNCRKPACQRAESEEGAERRDPGRPSGLRSRHRKRRRVQSESYNGVELTGDGGAAGVRCNDVLGDRQPSQSGLVAQDPFWVRFG
jgi:hypothetical protein